MTMPDGTMWEEIGSDGKAKKKGMVHLRGNLNVNSFEREYFVYGTCFYP